MVRSNGEAVSRWVSADQGIAYFHHQDSERANREMLRATRIMDRLAGFLGQNAG